MVRSVFRLLCLMSGAFCLGCSAPEAENGMVFTYGWHTYEIEKEAMTWDEAARCATFRKMYGVTGHLVRIDSSGENRAIHEHLIAAIPKSEFDKTSAPDGGGGAYVWIGASDASDEGKWAWAEGDKPFWSGGKNGAAVEGQYSNWGTVDGTQNEPDNWGGDQNAGALSLDGWPKTDRHLGSAGQWNDIKADNRLYSVVEYDAVPPPHLLALLGSAFLAVTAIFLWTRFRAGADSAKEA